MPTHQGHPLFVPLSACRTFYYESLPVNRTIIENAFWYSYRGERKRDMPERFNCAISRAILYFVFTERIQTEGENKKAVEYRLFYFKNLKYTVILKTRLIVIGIKTTLLLQIIMKVLL